jgi:dihydrofolate reductase
MVFWHVVMSLDGFIAGAGDDMSWVFDVVSADAAVDDEHVAATGAVVMGRRTFEVEDRIRPGIYGGRYRGPLFVVTSHPPDHPPEWMTSGGMDGRFVSDGVLAAIVALLGARVARQAIDAGLLDEVLVQIAPVMLGDGVRLFDRPGGAAVRLTKSAVSETEALTNLAFRCR